MDVRAGPQRGLSTGDLMLFNCRLEKTLGSLLNSKELKPVNQPWIFIGRTGAEAEAPVLWKPDAESRHIGKDPYAGKDWGQEEKGTTEDEMAGWQHWLNGHKLSKLQEIVKGREAWYAVAHGVAKSQTWLSDWTKTKILFKDILCILGFFYAHFKWGWSVKLLHIFYTFRFFRFNSISSANNYFAFSFPSCTS